VVSALAENFTALLTGNAFFSQAVVSLPPFCRQNYTRRRDVAELARVQT
jgi:hypothetical protein